jgi:hypothetical protein
MRIDIVEKVTAGVKQVDFMRRDQRTNRQWILAYELDYRAVRFGIGVQWEIDSLRSASSPRCAAHAGKTFRIELLLVVTPMK